MDGIERIDTVGAVEDRGDRRFRTATTSRGRRIEVSEEWFRAVAEVDIETEHAFQVVRDRFDMTVFSSPGQGPVVWVDVVRGTTTLQFGSGHLPRQGPQNDVIVYLRDERGLFPNAPENMFEVQDELQVNSLERLASAFLAGRPPRMLDFEVVLVGYPPGVTPDSDLQERGFEEVPLVQAMREHREPLSRFPVEQQWGAIFRLRRPEEQ